MPDGQNDTEIDAFIAQWRSTGGSEIANTQSFINGLCQLLGVEAPDGSQENEAKNDYVFERGVYQDNGDGSQSFGRIDCYKKNCFVLEAKQGSEGDRAAAARGEDDLDLFGQSATHRLKRGTARRGTPAWARAMLQAKGQAERYAKALPTDHGWPPILMITDVGYCIDVYADFTGTGKAYAQFPSRNTYRIMLDDLHDEDVRKRLRLIWTNPYSLDPSIRSARATREIAELLAIVSKRLEKRGHDATTVSAFLMRTLFTMFAEDTGVLLPKGSFSKLLQTQLESPEHLHHQLTALWAAMDEGEFSPSLGIPVKRFNGYLFKSRDALPLEREELQVLIEAANRDWTEVEPAIFGTLLERALNPKERAKLAAHYTPREYVERLVGPTIVEPLRNDWDGVKGAVESLIGDEDIKGARRVVEAFHGKLASTKVLDPACGTGNFLYVAMARMKELEGEVLELLSELGDEQYLTDLSGGTITPENFLGIEKNPRAAAIAQLVLWIGYLQWYFKVNGKDRAPPEPILQDIRTIENRDALMQWEGREVQLDEQGKTRTRWDGETMRAHPVTGEEVPDTTARVEIYRYIKPTKALWPKADFIVGNPPFIGKGKRAVEYLGRDYLDALRLVSDVKLSADYVMHWWHRAADLVRKGKARRFGLITSSTITQIFNARVLKPHLNAKKAPVSIAFAISDHPWVDEKGSAAVRIAMTVGTLGEQSGTLQKVEDERGAPTDIKFSSKHGMISYNLVIGSDAKAAKSLASNDKICSPGIKTFGKGFILSPQLSERWRKNLPKKELDILKPYYGGKDITERWHGRFVIDADALSESELKTEYPTFFSHLYNYVKPERDENNDEQRREEWWRFGRRNTELRSAVAGLPRFIVTTETAQHRVFSFLSPPDFPEGGLVVIASPDAYHLGILSSATHFTWMKNSKGALETRPRYNKTRCFDPFPFPSDVSQDLKEKIREEAEGLEKTRNRVLRENEDLTLTKLYNILEALRSGEGLSHEDTKIHDRGLVTLLGRYHDTIDNLVCQAYGWPLQISEEETLDRLVELNQIRVTEENNGVTRYLRPAYQDPGYSPPQNQMLDFGDEFAAAAVNVRNWPNELPQQVSAVQYCLTTAGMPLNAREVARNFRGKRASSVLPILEALRGIGMARRLSDGRYAA